MAELLTQGIVRILDGNGDIAGTGFVISAFGLIATCSHVIQHETLQEYGIAPPQKVRVIFHATGDEQDALVESRWWLPWNNGDLAIIQVEGTLPLGVQPLPLGAAKGTSGHEIATFGFPDIADIQGLGGEGKVVTVLSGAGGLMLQLQSSEITAGFSGAPIWDKMGRHVIGMVSAITEPDRHSRLEKTAFAIATETLRSVCPVLKLSDVCPYRGLAAFIEVDSKFFFGRKRVIDDLVASLRKESRFLAVLGPSGSGKSSVVQAGLVPRLRQGAVPGSDNWEIVITRPTDRDFSRLLINLHQDHRTSMRGPHVALIIDQFEELYITSSTTVSQDTVTSLTELLKNCPRISIILTLRDDFYSRFVQQETLAQRLGGALVNIPPQIKRDELTDIVQEPAKAVGLSFENGLVEMIIKDVTETISTSGERGHVGFSTILPLLEFTLAQLWERRKEGMLTRVAYDNIGGVTGGLAQWANETFYGLEERKRSLARRIFTDLVYLGDEEQHIPDSRQQRSLTSLCRSEEEREDVSEVVQQLTNARLLVTSRDKQGKEETVEMIHEALLREWGELHRWIAEDRYFLVWHQELVRRMRGWIDTNSSDIAQRDEDKLLRGRELVEAERWPTQYPKALSEEERAFIRASIKEKQRQEQEERERKEVELSLRRRATNRQKLLVSLIVVVLLMVILAPLIARAIALARFQILLASVTNLNSDGPGSLRQAIKDASPNSTITFANGLSGTIALSNNNPGITINKNLIISGPGSSVLSISGSNSYRVFNIAPQASVTISGLTITGGLVDAYDTPRGDILDGASGSSIYNAGSLEIRNCIVTGNENDLYYSGGAIFNGSNAAISISNSTISGNTLYAEDLGPAPSNSDEKRGGGGFNNAGVAILTNSTVSGNEVTRGNGGGIFNSGTLTIQGSTISNNEVKTSGDAGGGIFNSGTLNIRDSTIDGNTAINGEGAGIFNSGTLTLQTSTISRNILMNGRGGGIYTENTLSLYDCTISGNIVTNGSGGGIGVAKMTGRLDDSISYCTIYNNTAPNGGGVLLSNQYGSSVGKVIMRYSILAGNHASKNQDIIGALFVSGHNLIEDETNATIYVIPGEDSAAPLTGVSPKLGPLQNNGGPTQTHAVLPGSPVIGLAPCSTPTGPEIRSDQRGVPNYDFGSPCTIGSYQPGPL